MDWMSLNQFHLIYTLHAALDIQMLFDLLLTGLLTVSDMQILIDSDYFHFIIIVCGTCGHRAFPIVRVMLYLVDIDTIFSVLIKRCLLIVSEICDTSTSLTAFSSNETRDYSACPLTPRGD